MTFFQANNIKCLHFFKGILALALHFFKGMRNSLEGEKSYSISYRKQINNFYCFYITNYCCPVQNDAEGVTAR